MTKTCPKRKMGMTEMSQGKYRRDKDLSKREEDNDKKFTQQEDNKDMSQDEDHFDKGMS